MIFPDMPSSLPPLSLYASLVPKKDRELFWQYLFYISLLASRGLRQKGTHHGSFRLLYRAVSRPWAEDTLLGRLQKEFVARNVSLSLLLEPLDGFEWLSKNRYPLVFASASPIWLQILAPLSRFIAVLNNQKPPFYQPFAGLLFALAAIYVAASPSAVAALRAARVEINPPLLSDGISQAQTDIVQALSAAEGWIFRIKIGFFIGISRALTGRYAKKMPLKLSFFDYVNAFLYGLWQTLTIRNKTRGLNRL